jgi:hypothetical protein
MNVSSMTHYAVCGVWCVVITTNKQTNESQQNLALRISLEVAVRGLGSITSEPSSTAVMSRSARPRVSVERVCREGTKLKKKLAKRNSSHHKKDMDGRDPVGRTRALDCTAILVTC